ncbi:MAG: acetyl-CoA carboxylase biotin carboxylase subunit [Halioglobus sp.]
MTIFHKVLVANRGEIALRIIRCARAMGIETVAVYSEIDRSSPHVLAADEAVCIGPAPADQSYLSCDRLLDAAKRTAATMIHPGYGFLSENADFASASQQAGLIFIGPPSEIIELMGSKRAAKQVAQAAGIPCIPGYQGTDQSESRFLEEAERIGYPVMIKASYGGGGRGMRLVRDASELGEQITSARSEAESTFANGELILEKALIDARHIEFQIFADQHGNAVHLGERDCSVQRRHQKVLEESPSPFINEDRRRKMGETAVSLVKHCKYVGAGTVEFMVDNDGKFYFLEMNTRLQVEHPVSEMVTNVDLVSWQFKVACGETLPLAQDDITLKGHAIEMRLYAEDPAQHFLPQTGLIQRWQPTVREGLRVDHGIAEGLEVSSFYDPMLAKIIAHGEDRDTALRRLYCGLKDTTLLGVKTNKAYILGLLKSPAFSSGNYSTTMMERYLAEKAQSVSSEAIDIAAGLAAVVFHHTQLDQNKRGAIAPRPVHYLLLARQHRFAIELSAPQDSGRTVYQLELGGNRREIELVDVGQQTCTAVIEGIRLTVPFAESGNRLSLEFEDMHFSFENFSYLSNAEHSVGGDGNLVAEMEGVIVAVLCRENETVSAEQPVLVMEAMKMEHQILAGTEGVIGAIKVQAGDTVVAQQLLATVREDNQTT